MGYSQVLPYAITTGCFIAVIYLASLIAPVAALPFAHGAEVIKPGIKFAAAIVARPDEFILGLKFFPGRFRSQSASPTHLDSRLQRERPLGTLAEQDVDGEGTAFLLVGFVKGNYGLLRLVNQFGHFMTRKTWCIGIIGYLP